MIATPPKRILMIKSHSMGVGDLLRSSAAWRMLINTWPGVELHLLFLSKHAGYTTEELIKEHHLLSSASFITVRAHDPSVKNAQRLPICKVLAQVQALTLSLDPDLIIDFEPHGLKTSFITWMAAKACHATTVGIAQFPVRSWFYMLCAPSMRNYAQIYGLIQPFERSRIRRPHQVQHNRKTLFSQGGHGLHHMPLVLVLIDDRHVQHAIRVDIVVFSDGTLQFGCLVEARVEPMRYDAGLPA